MNILEAKKVVCDSGKRMLKMGHVAGTWGNISQRVDKDCMVITPSGMDYEKLVPEQMVVVNINDLSYEGDLKPSVETGLHAGIYKERPEINSIIHNHSQNACTVAAAHKEIPPILDDMVQIIGGSLRVSEYGLPGSEALDKNSIKALGKDRNAVLIANHGAVCAGRDLDEVFVMCQIVEKACRTFIDVQALGGAVNLKEEDVRFMRNFFVEKYGQR